MWYLWYHFSALLAHFSHWASNLCDYTFLCIQENLFEPLKLTTIWNLWKQPLKNFLMQLQKGFDPIVVAQWREKVVKGHNKWRQFLHTSLRDWYLTVHGTTQWHTLDSDLFGRKSSNKYFFVWKYIAGFHSNIKGHWIPL